MTENSPIRWPSNVPYNVYVSMSGGGQGCNTNFDIGQHNDIFVSVYKSLDKGHGSQSVEHVVQVGTFQVVNVKDKNVGEFLRDVRIGIEKLVGVEVESGSEPARTI